VEKNKFFSATTPLTDLELLFHRVKTAFLKVYDETVKGVKRCHENIPVEVSDTTM